MLKEEKELRKWVTRLTRDHERSRCYADIRALVRAVREDCAKIESETAPCQECADRIAAAIRAKK